MTAREVRAKGSKKAKRIRRVPLFGETPNLDAFSIGEFCARHGPISRAFYYVLRKDGKAPREMRVGGRVLISAEAAAQWRRDRETAPALGDAS